MDHSPYCTRRIGTRQQSEQKHHKLTRYIPEDRFASGKCNLEIVKLSNVITESTLLDAQLDLVRKGPELLRLSGKYDPAHTEYEELNSDYHDSNSMLF